MRKLRMLPGLRIFALPSRGEALGWCTGSDGAAQTGHRRSAWRSTEVIDDRKNGIPGATRRRRANWPRHWKTLLVAPELRREMGARGRERVEQEFRFNVFAKSLKKILRDLCDECESCTLRRPIFHFLEFGGPPVKVRVAIAAARKAGPPVTVPNSGWGLKSRATAAVVNISEERRLGGGGSRKAESRRFT